MLEKENHFGSLFCYINLNISDLNIVGNVNMRFRGVT